MPLTPQEQEELAQLEAKYAPQKKSKLSPAEEKELADLEAQYGGQEQSLGAKALDYGVRGLDYVGGVIRTGLANTAGLVSGKGTVVTEEDLGNMAKGKAPMSSEYLKRLGVPEGPSLDFSKATGGMLPFGKISARDVGGFAADVATDPLTAITKGVKVLRPGSTLAEKSGEKIYKSGLKNVDKYLVEKGKNPVSDLLFQSRRAGSMEKISKGAAEDAKKLMNQRDELYQLATDAGAKVDLTNIGSSADSVVAKARKNPRTRELADRLQEVLDDYRTEGSASLQDASDWKSSLYENLPQNAFGPNGKLRGPAKKFDKALAKDFKIAIENSADEVAPGMGKQISQVNDQWSRLAGDDSVKAFNRAVRSEKTKNPVTQVDMMFSTMGAAAGGAVGGIPGAVAGGALTYGGKNAARLANSTKGRTRGGLLLNDLGKSGLIDATARRGLIDRNR